MLNTRILRDYIATKMTLDNYDKLTDSKKYVQNMCNSLELVIQDNHVMCKILPTTFKGLVRAWYNKLKPGLVTSFNDLCVKLVAYFSTSIPAKKISTKSFNEEMLKVEDLIEPVASKSLISGVREKNIMEGVVLSTR